MDAAAFVGNGVLAERLADFIQENLDDAAAIASLTDSDLSNVNGQPLSESELVRVSAQHTLRAVAARSQLARRRRSRVCSHARRWRASATPRHVREPRAASLHISPTRETCRPAAGARNF